MFDTLVSKVNNIFEVERTSSIVPSYITPPPPPPCAPRKSGLVAYWLSLFKGLCSNFVSNKNEQIKKLFLNINEVKSTNDAKLQGRRYSADVSRAICNENKFNDSRQIVNILLSKCSGEQNPAKQNVNCSKRIHAFSCSYYLMAAVCSLHHVLNLGQTSFKISSSYLRVSAKTFIAKRCAKFLLYKYILNNNSLKLRKLIIINARLMGFKIGRNMFYGHDQPSCMNPL